MTKFEKLLNEYDEAAEDLRAYGDILCAARKQKARDALIEYVRDVEPKSIFSESERLGFR